MTRTQLAYHQEAFDNIEQVKSDDKAKFNKHFLPKNSKLGSTLLLDGT
jgi:hypothetical protein